MPVGVYTLPKQYSHALKIYTGAHTHLHTRDPLNLPSRRSCQVILHPFFELLLPRSLYQYIEEKHTAGRCTVS